MLTKYKGWSIEFQGNGYRLARIEAVEDKTIIKYAKTQAQAKIVITNEEDRISREAEARIKRERERVITKRYEVQLTNHEPVTFTFERSPSAAYAYGNQTSVTVHENDRFLGIVDTRYDNSVLKDFGAWCVDYLKSYIDPKYEPQITEV